MTPTNSTLLPPLDYSVTKFARYRAPWQRKVAAFLVSPPRRLSDGRTYEGGRCATVSETVSV